MIKILEIIKSLALKSHRAKDLNLIKGDD